MMDGVRPIVRDVQRAVGAGDYVESNAAASDAGPLPAKVPDELKEHRWVWNFYS